MFNRKKEISLDLSTQTIYGYEREKNPIVIWNMILGIRVFSDFLPVEIKPIEEDDSFQLLRKRDLIVGGVGDGGHNRVIAHLIEAVPLSALVYSKQAALEPENFDIRQSVITDNESDMQYYKRVHKNACIEEVYGRKPYTKIPTPDDIAYMQERMDTLRAQNM